jgi:PTH1 family peptidyl-tRNA hydrolase
MKLIVGLGNPGDRYRFTRHNMGYLVLDGLAEEHGISVRRKKFDADIGEGVIAGAPVLLAKPRTYMNLSGTAVIRLSGFFKIDLTDIVVVHDDLDLAFGSVRVKEGGGHGGHKGMISVIQHLGAREFTRVRLGIGKPLLKVMVEDYVLQIFSRDEMEALPDILRRAADAVVEILTSGPQAAMCRFNVRRVKGENREEDPCST